jgi:uncharacterized membrane protein
MVWLILFSFEISALLCFLSDWFIGYIVAVCCLLSSVIMVGFVEDTKRFNKKGKRKVF